MVSGRGLGVVMTENIGKLAWEISNCAEVCAAKSDVSHPCHGVVSWQHKQWQSSEPSLSDEVITSRKMQRPEAWTGDLANAKILFLASNPSFDADERFPTWDETGEAWPGHSWGQEQVVEFATRRFIDAGTRDFGATDGPTLADADRTILRDGTLSKRVNHWGWVRNLAAYILDKSPEDVSAHDDYVMTEMVHCKSTYEAGVPKAISKCSTMWLERMWQNAGAEIVVIAGAKSGEEFARLYGDQLPDTWGSWTTKPSCPTKGKGSWPSSGEELQRWAADGRWGENEQSVHAASLVLGGKRRLVIYFARPGGSKPTAPWKNPELVHPNVVAKWREFIAGGGDGFGAEADTASFDLDFELTPYAKTTMSWMLVTELLKHADGPQRVLNLFPFGGQYDCLALADERGNQKLLVNRLGDSALVGDDVVSPIWGRVAYSPAEAARFVMSESGLALGRGSEVNEAAILGAAKIAQFCANDLYESAEVVWCWNEFDSEKPNLSVLDEIPIPDEWRAAEPPVPGTTWAAWLWLLVRKGEAVAVANLMTGEVIRCSDGKPYLYGSEIIRDDLNEPIVPIAYLLTPEGPNPQVSSFIVRPSLARGTVKHMAEEGDLMRMKPLFHLNTAAEVRDMWCQAYGAWPVKES